MHDGGVGMIDEAYLKEIGLDDASDWMDRQHLNCNGQAKLTRYMADRGYVR